MDVNSSTVQLNTSDGKMDAYVAQPKDGGNYPGVVVIQEAFGVNDHIKKVTERLAAEGYVAIAPDIFHREAERIISYLLERGFIRPAGTTTDGALEANYEEELVI